MNSETAWLCVLSLPLASIAIRDFRHREVTLWQLLALAAAAVAYAIARHPAGAVAWHALLNTCFLGVQGLLLWLWFVAKTRNLRFPLESQIGLGDGLVLLCLTPVMPPEAFLWFYVSGVSGCLILVMVVRFFRPAAFSTIPLAGLLALWLIVFLIYTNHLP